MSPGPKGANWVRGPKGPWGPGPKGANWAQGPKGPLGPGPKGANWARAPRDPSMHEPELVFDLNRYEPEPI